LINETHLELIKLTETLSKEGISVQTAIRFFRTMLESDSTILSELKVMNHAELVFKKKFLKRGETPDLISEDNTIAIEVKSFNEATPLENAIKLWWIPRKNEAHKLKQLGTLILLREQGVKVYIAIHNRINDAITIISLDDILKHIPSNYIETAKRYALNKQKGRPPKISDDIILKYLKKYKGLSKKDIWKIMVKDGYEISYDRFLRRIKKLLRKK